MNHPIIYSSNLYRSSNFYKDLGLVRVSRRDMEKLTRELYKANPDDPSITLEVLYRWGTQELESYEKRAGLSSCRSLG